MTNIAPRSTTSPSRACAPDWGTARPSRNGSPVAVPCRPGSRPRLRRTRPMSCSSRTALASSPRARNAATACAPSMARTNGVRGPLKAVSAAVAGDLFGHLLGPAAGIGALMLARFRRCCDTDPTARLRPPDLPTRPGPRPRRRAEAGAHRCRSCLRSGAVRTRETAAAAPPPARGCPAGWRRFRRRKSKSGRSPARAGLFQRGLGTGSIAGRDLHPRQQGEGSRTLAMVRMVG